MPLLPHGAPHCGSLTASGLNVYITIFLVFTISLTINVDCSHIALRRTWDTWKLAQYSKPPARNYARRLLAIDCLIFTLPLIQHLNVMRTNSDSTGSSDVSVIASLDALSLSSPSTSSPSITSGNQPGARVISGSSEDYEIILVPTDCTRRVSSSSTSSGVLVNATDSSETDGKGSDDSGAKGKSIARRERRRKLESAKGKAQTTTGTTTDNQATPKKAPQTLDSAIEKPQAHESSAGSTSSAFDEPHRKTRRGGQRNRMRLDRAEVRKTLTTVDDLTTPSTSPSKMRSTRSVTADDSSEDGASRFMDEGLDDEDEVDGMSVLEMRPESVGGTPVNRRKLNAGSVTTTEDASSCIDR